MNKLYSPADRMSWIHRKIKHKASCQNGLKSQSEAEEQSKKPGQKLNDRIKYLHPREISAD